LPSRIFVVTASIPGRVSCSRIACRWLVLVESPVVLVERLLRPGGQPGQQQQQQQQQQQHRTSCSQPVTRQGLGTFLAVSNRSVPESILDDLRKDPRPVLMTSAPLELPDAPRRHESPPSRHSRRGARVMLFTSGPCTRDEAAQ
jgi:hypothetical protein